MADAATIRDVARQAGVGVGTVSRVLNDRQAVSPATKEKVLQAIEFLDYSPSPAARRLSSGVSMAIGVIVPFFTNPSVVKRLQGVVSVVSASDYDLVLFDVENAANRQNLLTNAARRKMVDGLLIISLRPDEEDMERFLESEMPAVMVDAEHTQLSRVSIDNIEGGVRATQHLLELGHTRIAYISDIPQNPFNYTPTHERHLGYRMALNDAGLADEPQYYRYGELSSDTARMLTHELLELPQPPTAVFAYSDTQAIGVLEAARERGLEVPRDLSVVGYDDIDTAEHIGLTTIRQSLFESGAAGARLLMQVMRQPLEEPVQERLPTELVIRQTTAPPGGAR